VRVYGRITNPDGSKTWEVVQTDPATGSNEWVYLTALCQALLLNLGESPFYADVGLPGQQSVIQQIQPDFYVTRIQQRYSQYFASLIVAKDPSQANPTYNVKVTMFDGTPASVTVQIPQ
jgi:hypothetical protein